MNRIEKILEFLSQQPQDNFLRHALALEYIKIGEDQKARDLFIEKGKGGLFFIPEDSDDLSEKIYFLNSNRNELSTLGENGKQYVSVNFNRKKIAEQFYKEICKVNIQ